MRSKWLNGILAQTHSAMIGAALRPSSLSLLGNVRMRIITVLFLTAASVWVLVASASADEVTLALGTTLVDAGETAEVPVTVLLRNISPLGDASQIA